MGYWRKFMRFKIAEAIHALPPNPSKEEIAIAIKKSYPLTVRENFPYQVWLDEKDRFLIAYGIKKFKPESERYKAMRKQKPPTNPDGVVDGQLRLFDF
jgi:hypothetical protein